MIGSPFYALAKCVTPGHYSDSIDVITLVTYGVIKPRNVHITLSTSGQYLGTFALTTCQIREKNTPPPPPILVECIVSFTAAQKRSSALTPKGRLDQPSF